MPVEVPTVTDKQIAVEALGRMPEASTLQQISEELAILAAIHAGQADADAARVISHEELKLRSESWTSR